MLCDSETALFETENGGSEGKMQLKFTCSCHIIIKNSIIINEIFQIENQDNTIRERGIF